MEGAVLADEHTAVDGNDVVFWKSFLQLAAGEVVILWLAVGRHENGAVDYQEISVCGGQAMAIVWIVDG